MNSQRGLQAAKHSATLHPLGMNFPNGLAAGEVLTIPPELPLSAGALEDTLDVDVFNPPRQDWLDGTDAYLRNR